VNEKETALLSDDYGRDLASVQALQRKHEGLERDLDALEEKVKTLRMDAVQLVGTQPKSSKVVREKEKEIMDAWNTLKSRVSLARR
jgi:spectrin alpha